MIRAQRIDEIRDRARRRYRELEIRRKDPIFVRAIGKLVYLKMLEVPNGAEFKPYRGTVFLREMLWAGEAEPRIFELLPALLLKKPKAIVIANQTLPEDLKQVLQELRRNRPVTAFRGIPAFAYAKWVEKIGHAGKRPTLMKTFRFTADDLERLDRIRKKVPNMNEAEILRAALERFERSLDA